MHQINKLLFLNIDNGIKHIVIFKIFLHENYL
jgi:hypothetical protein